MPDLVNGAITDSVTQANVKVLGDAPAQAMGNLFQAMSQSMSLAANNAVTAQQQGNVIHQAATTIGVSVLYSLGSAQTGASATAVAE